MVPMTLRRQPLRRVQRGAPSRRMKGSVNAGGTRGRLVVPRRAVVNQPASTNGAVIIRTANPRVAGVPATHHFNAFGTQIPQALAFSVGPATMISGAKRFSLPLVSAQTIKSTLLIFQPGAGIEQAVVATENPDGSWILGAVETIDSTGIKLGPASETNPANIMCSRGSIRIRNLTAAGKVAGAVHILRSSTGLPNLLQSSSTSKAAGIKNLILENSRTVTMSGSQLTLSHQWDCIPVSQDRYHAFAPPGNYSFSVVDPGISSVCVLLEHVDGESQQYEFSMAASYYGRYNVIGPLANSAITPPTVGLPIINKLRDAAESVGSMGKPVMQAIGGFLRDTAVEMTPGFAGNLRNMNRPFPALTNARPMLALPAP